MQHQGNWKNRWSVLMLFHVPNGQVKSLYRFCKELHKILRAKKVKNQTYQISKVRLFNRKILKASKQDVGHF